MRHNQMGWTFPIAGVLLLAGSLHAAQGHEDSFFEKINLEKFRLIAVQHDGRFKTFDTLARSMLRIVSSDDTLKRPVAGSDKPVKQDAAFTYLDFMFNSAAYQDVRLLYVKSPEVRKQLLIAAGDRVDPATQREILKDGRVSMTFLQIPEVQARLDELSRDVMRTAKKVEELLNAAQFMQPESLLQLMRVVPPSRAASIQDRWYSIADLNASAPTDAMHAGMTGGGPLPNMDFAAQQVLASDWSSLQKAWAAGDATAVNAALDSLAGRLAQVAPQVYPPHSKLALEHFYYKYNKMMWSWGFYFLAVVFLLMGVVYRWPKAAKTGLVFFGIGFLLHTAACGLRWYLAGHIPNANMFEAVTAAAWLGAAVAIFLELGPIWSRWPVAWQAAWAATVGGLLVWLGTLLIQRIPVAAWQQWGPVPIAALLIFVAGCMALISLAVAGQMARYKGLLVLAGSGISMVALMCGQFMKNSLDSDIGRTMPVLNDLWLYVHTNMIIASYALIGMAFITAALYLVGRLLTTPLEQARGLWLVILFFTIVIPLPALAPEIGLLNVMSAWAPFLIVLGMFAIAAIARLVWRTGAQRAYERWEGLPLGMAGMVGGSGRLAPGAAAFSALNSDEIDDTEGGNGRRESLARVFDGATMLSLELSFIMLWTGIIMGAIWADHSWGRPWGWDPKEVFALNTWIIFLILVHVRLRVKDRELWTALLAVIGTSVMMFNWVVVNFFITGLHSYA